MADLSQKEILELCARMEKLYTAAVSDVLDELGMWEQVMEVGFTPILPEAAVAGPAFTMNEDKAAAQRVTLDEMDPGLLVGILDGFCSALQEGQVIVVNTNGFWGAGAYGELMATTAKYYGGVKGAVVDGPMRDISRVIEIGFPVWAKGSIPTDSVGRAQLIGINDTITCGGVEVNPNDIVFADRDGIVVIPQSADLKLIVEKAEEVANAERQSREELRNGASLRDVYEKYGRL